MFAIRTFESRTVSWWHDQKEFIDFEPPYQRKGKIWSPNDKAFLIDSIINSFDMPKLYIADFTFFSSELNKSRKPYAVIDGKQRFEAIFEFYENNLTLAKNFDYLEDTNLKLGGLSFKDLQSQHPKIASKFENFNLPVFSVITDIEGMINELFIRLNSTSKKLTGAEVRMAMEGPVPRFIKRLTSNKFFKDKIRFNVQRGQDTNVAAKLLLIEFRGKFVDTKRIHLDKLVQDLYGAETSIEPTYQKIVEVLNSMNGVFIDEDPLLSSSGLIPVYYWFIRNFGKEYKSQIRNFLVHFENKRKETRDIQNEESGFNLNPLDQLEPLKRLQLIDYIQFDRLSKSLNDQSSLSGCYSILLKKWKLWLLDSVN